MDLRDYFSYFIKKAWIIATTLILCTVISGGLTYFNSITYLSTPKIIIGPQTYVSKDGKFTSNLVNVISGLIDNDKVVARLSSETGLKIEKESIRNVVGTDLNDLHQRIYLIVRSTDKETVRLVADKLPDILAATSKELFNIDNLLIIKSDKIVTEGKNYKKNAVAGAVSGAGLGFLIVFILLIYDDRLRNRFDIRRLFGLNYLGNISNNSSGKKVKENNLSLVCTRLLIKMNKVSKKIIANIIIDPQNKKDYTYSIASQMAMLGNRTLFVELDKSSGVLDGKTKDPVKYGISDIISDVDLGHADVIYKTNSANLEVVPFGSLEDISHQMLLKHGFKSFSDNVRKEYDVVLVNIPSEAGIERILSLSPFYDGTILTVKEGVVKTQEAENVIENLKETETSILGYTMA